MPRAKTAGQAVPASDKEMGAVSPVEPVITETENIETVLQAGQAEQEKSLTEQAEDTDPADGVAPGAEPLSRSAMLAALAGGGSPRPAGADSDPVVAAVPAVRKTGTTQVWADGDKELVQALVLVGMFKSTVGGRARQGYKGDVLEAPADVIERGVKIGALSKEL